jgi:hypothetical protein
VRGCKLTRMFETEPKRARVDREEWAKRVERWRDSGLTTAEFAAELGINPRTLTYWAWMLKREASGGKRHRPAKARKQTAASAPAGNTTPRAVAAFVEVQGRTPHARFELEVRGRRLHIPEGFDAQQLRSLLEILETA